MIIDLSHIITNGMPAYPGDAETELTQTKRFQVDYYNNFQLSMNMHAGTHIDGPMHLTDANVYLSDFSVDSFIGEGCLIDVSGETIIDYKTDYEQSVKEGQIVIIHTGHSKRFGQPEYFTEYPVLTPNFADFIVRKKVKMIGLDTPTPDKYPFEIHKYLFNNNVLIIENLTNVERLLNIESFEIIALPMPVQADSSIARVVARVGQFRK